MKNVAKRKTLARRTRSLNFIHTLYLWLISFCGVSKPGWLFSTSVTHWTSNCRSEAPSRDVHLANSPENEAKPWRERSVLRNVRNAASNSKIARPLHGWTFPILSYYQHIRMSMYHRLWLKYGSKEKSRPLQQKTKEHLLRPAVSQPTKNTAVTWSGTREKRGTSYSKYTQSRKQPNTRLYFFKLNEHPQSQLTAVSFDSERPKMQFGQRWLRVWVLLGWTVGVLSRRDG